VSAIARPAFIVGCARSGTSILGEAVAADPRVTYLYEVSPLWDKVLPERPDHRLTREDATAQTAAALRAELSGRAAEAGREVLVEKNPKHTLRIPFIDAIFADSRFIHIIRDGRDTVASLMFRNRGPDWGHLKTPGWEDLLRRYPTENHIRCAHQWRDSVRICRDDGRALPPGRYLEVRFEDLVRDPGPILEGLFRFLDLDLDQGQGGLAPSVKAFLPKIQDATAGSYHAKRQVRHYMDNHAVRVGRFRENLTAEQLVQVEAICGDLLRELGYN